MVVKTKSGYVVKNHTGQKNLSKVYKTEGAAVKRLRQIEYFKHAKK